MGTYQFKWSKPADEVYVTGTFDNWGKTVKLNKENGIFTKLVDLPSANEKYFYKYVVDGNWTTDPDDDTENDESGNSNNVLSPDEITPLAAGGRSHAGGHPDPISTSALISGIGPGATTTHLAADVPKEAKEIPGAFPDDDFAPGDMVPDYSRFSSKADDQTVSVNPLPATAGTGNPVDLKPGEKVPPTSEVTSSTIASNVKLDKASYEKSDAYPTASKPADTQAGAFGVPPVNPGATVIPESGLPMGSATGPQADGGVDASGIAAAGPTISSAGAGTTTAALAGAVPKEPRGVAHVVDDNNTTDPTISSAGAGTTTAALAGQVPKEPRGVPQVVDDSQVDAQVTQPSQETASAKADVAEEVKTQVPEKESESSSRGGILGAAAATGAAALGGMAAAASGLLGGGKKETSEEKPADDVPETVKDSLKTAGASPEAAANPEAVSEKKAAEAELIRDGPTIADEDTAAAIAAATGAGTLTGAGAAAASGQATTLGSGTTVEAFKSDPVAAPGASTTDSSKAAPDVAAFKTDPVSSSGTYVAAFNNDPTSAPGGSAPAETSKEPAVEAFKNDPVAASTKDSSKVEGNTIATASNIVVPSDSRARELSRDISPHSLPTGPTTSKSKHDSAAPTSSSAVPVTSGTDSTDHVTKDVTDKKAKRRSFFGKIKDKLKHKD